MNRPRTFMDRFTVGIWRSLTVEGDTPWAAGDYPDLLAMAESMLAARQKRFPELVRAGKMDQSQADSTIAIYAAIVADWRWIVTGEGQGASLPTLDARKAALDGSLDTIAQIAGERRGFTRELALQAQHVIAMRWHLEPERETHFFAAITHKIRADLARKNAGAANAAPALLRSAA
ncbi:hypothetical protein [Novosphingobium guangzhouense]|uniref:Uncharacterized protein n=1 Tax=Novosphingobium guangzhouense TaxID=1850347 RepID=A0A2K2G602_9SPHN|nr:hypothetical protein [Novosphingobium guangzhouense]PNU06454.1 hypothetical protein A8V01_02605 [Novosphingobium guangzhouense]